MIERLLKNNNIVKVIAFFLALMLWTYVTGGAQRASVQDVTRTITGVPLAWRNLNDRLELMRIPGEVDVVLRGELDVVYGIKPQELEVYVDLRGLEEGIHRLTPNALVPRGIRVDSFRPQQVVVELEEVIFQHKQVSLQVHGQPGDGLLTGDPRILPDQVFIRGPRSVLERVFQVWAEIQMSGAEDDIVQTVPVKAVDSDGNEVQEVAVNPDMVEVHVPVLLPEKTVTVKVPVEGEPAPGFRVTEVQVQPPTITARGRARQLQQVSELTTAPVSVQDAMQNIVVELPLTSPAGVELLPATVRVEIVIEAM